MFTWQEWSILLGWYFVPHAIFTFCWYFGTPWPEKPTGTIPFSVNGQPGEIEHEAWQPSNYPVRILPPGEPDTLLRSGRIVSEDME
jgi:hypothetical protein